MSADSLAGQMRAAASSLLASLDGEQRELAARPFADDAARRWLEYRPRSRPGACIAGLSGTATKAAHRLLATGLSEHAYTQAMGIVALEEVLARKEQWRRGPPHRPSQGIEPPGVPATGLGPAAGALLAQMVALYLDRLPAELADRQAARLGGSELHFAWEGPLTPGARHYYRVQGDDLLIEYDTTADGNHAHTVLRRPRSDFGDDVLAAHYARAHP